MKKLVLGMMLLAGMAAYGEGTATTLPAKPGNGFQAEGTVNLRAYADGALKMELITKDIDFGNLRSYNGTAQDFTFKLKDENLDTLASTPAKITYTTTGLKNGTYTVGATVAATENVNVTKAGITVGSKIGLERTAANNAPAGEYTGTLIIKAEYTI
ncbi:MAG: hypothetical protein ACRC0Y_02525 [Fusobacteriaceae bacterium]